MFAKAWRPDTGWLAVVTGGVGVEEAVGGDAAEDKQGKGSLNVEVLVCLG